jgi:putative FmdB family regulatory protein
MPIYGYICTCGWHGDLMREIDQRDNAHCPNCTRNPERQLAAPMGKMAGQVARGGGADRFTAEALGIPLKELPPALKTPQDQCNG